QIYWIKHEDEQFLNCPVQLYNTPQMQYPNGASTATGLSGTSGQLPNSQYPGLQSPGGQPSLSPFSTPQQNMQWQDPRRQFQVTQWQAGAGDYFGGGSQDSPLSRIRPEDLPKLLSTSGTDSSLGGSNPFGSSATQGLSGSGMIPPSAAGGSS